MPRKIKFYILSVLFFLKVINSSAQVSVWQESRRGTIYFGCGINTPAILSSTLHIDQTDMNNSYDLINLKCKFGNSSGSSSITNYLSYFVGYYFNYNQTWGIELSYNPMVFYILDWQNAQLKGFKNAKYLDSNFTYSSATGNHYYLNSGSAILKCDLVRRYPLYRNKLRNISFDLLFKAGAGPIFIKPDTKVDNNSVTTQFSTSGGWDLNASCGLKVTLYRHIFGEVSMKYDNALLNNIDIYKGELSQKLTYTSISVNAGYTFPATRHNPLFRKGEKGRKKGIPSGPEPRGDLNPPPPDNKLIENY